MKFSPLTQRGNSPAQRINQRFLRRFWDNRRARYSFIIFLFMFVVSLFAEFIANDKPLYISYNGKNYWPVFVRYPEKEFGGYFDTEADYKDSFMQDIISKSRVVWPVVRFKYDTIHYATETPPPAPPSLQNPLGLDEHGRDVFARLIYGFRLSVIFGILLTVFRSATGIIAGAAQGYYGGRFDLFGQRFLEIWSGVPMLYLLIIASTMIRPGFWWLLFIMTVFGWTRLGGVVRAEFLKGRNLEYVKAARVLGVKDSIIMFRHILPNAVVAAMTFLPFILCSSIGMLTALDFLGFGMPPGSPSIGELLASGKNNIHAPWLGISAFVLLSLMMTLLLFVGEGLRDALDPRHIRQSPRRAAGQKPVKAD